MFGWRIEARVHGVDGDVGGTQLAPRSDLALPLVGSTITVVHACLDAECGGVAVSFSNVAAEALDGGAHLFVGLAEREPAVGEARGTTQGGFRRATRPDGDGTARGERIEASLADSVELALIGDDLLAPEPTQHIYLLIQDATSRVKVHVEPFVLHRIPADAHAEAEFAAAEDIDFRCLLGDEDRLALGQDDNRRGEFETTDGREIAEEHERFMKQALVRIALPTWTIGGICSQNMVVDDEMPVAELFGGLYIIADR